MWRRKIGRPAISVLAALALLFMHTLPAGAATSGGNGLRISPVRTDLTINPGQTQTVNVNVTNVTSSPATLQTIVNDFTASSDAYRTKATSRRRRSARSS
jgi:P pilus assembly chaperone PapD